MRRIVVGGLIVAGVGFSVLWSLARAADGELPRRPRTLSDRLEALRQDLIGQPHATRRTAKSTPANVDAADDGGDGDAADGDAPQRGKWSRTNGANAKPLTVDNPLARPVLSKEPISQDARAARPAPDREEPETIENDSAQRAMEARAARSADERERADRRPAQFDTSDSESTDEPVRPAQTPPRTKSQSLQERLAAARAAAGQRPAATAAAKPSTAKAPTGESKAVSATNDLFRGAAAANNRIPASKAEDKVKPAAAPRSEVKAAQHVSDDMVLITGQSPMLSVEATGPRKVRVGKEAPFVVKLTNAGEAAANNVVVSLKIPPFTEVSHAQPTAGSTRLPSDADAEPFEWRIDHLAAHAQQTLELRLVPRRSNPIELAMQWTCSPEATQTRVEVQEPKLLMVLSGPAEVLYGQSKVYKLTVSNPGNGDAENVSVALMPLSRGTEPVATHRLGTIAAGQSRTVEVELTARQTGQLTIKAQATADGELRTEVAEPVLVRRANLQIVVEGPKVKYAGTPCVYRLRITNSGDAVAENVELAAALPADAKYLSSTGGGRLEADQTKVRWTLGSLGPGAERKFELQATLLAAGENRMAITASGDADLAASETAATKVEALADLKLDLRDRQGPVEVGEPIVYEVVVRNRGTKAAESVDLAVFFSEGLEPIDANGGQHDLGDGQVVFRPLHSLAAGSEAVFHVRAKADRPGNHVFRAELVCTSLDTKLIAEETTRFYGETASEKANPAPPQRSTAGRHKSQEPRPIETDLDEAPEDLPLLIGEGGVIRR